ncbi:iron-containing alcohol dehydrogenase [Alicyclobacillus tolerans]|uniref:Alcohol dehydrogenase class IV n=1 Tax=Alicyclobacillus tolerans TaxID=90970 RepID=A0ABT9LUW0_9BACL|nr:iron-containing alcohol dehydrogenase [Alicyclobacillus tengchongensis]MDP9728040.1 alcohol dehydrogenase class IV [Alicyclobacillus tengchongensis]
MTTSHFQFNLPTIIHSGVGCRTLLPELLRGLGGKRALLVTDQGLKKAGVVQQITSLFEGLPQPVQLVGVFDEVEQDAKGAIINRAVSVYKSLAADCLIALGGGSVLDTVKAMKWMMHKGLTDIRMALVTNTIETFPRATRMSIPHIALPTTAGTGAEVSPISVVFNEMLQVKTNLIHPYAAADFALLDPDLTVGLPAFITAFTGMDALTHALEAYFSPVADPITDAFAIQSAQMIVENLPLAVANGQHLEARSNLLIASAMAITAFSTALNAIPVHNLAHALGAKFNIPHGLANAVLLPYVLEELPDFYLTRAQKFAAILGCNASSETPQADLQAIVEAIQNLRAKIHLPDTLTDYNIQEKDMDSIVQWVHSDPSGILFRLPEQMIRNVVRRARGMIQVVS